MDAVVVAGDGGLAARTCDRNIDTAAVTVTVTVTVKAAPKAKVGRLMI